MIDFLFKKCKNVKIIHFFVSNRQIWRHLTLFTLCDFCHFALGKSSQSYYFSENFRCFAKISLVESKSRVMMFYNLITPSKQFLRLKPIKKCIFCLQTNRFVARNVTKTRKHIFCSLLYLEFYLVVQSDRSLFPQKSSFRDAAQQYRFIKIMFETVKQMLILDSP